MATATYAVRGMTCEHCAAAVTEEVTKIAGVTGVRVDVAAGRVEVSSTEAVDAETLGGAVEEAGYELAEA